MDCLCRFVCDCRHFEPCLSLSKPCPAMSPDRRCLTAPAAPVSMPAVCSPASHAPSVKTCSRTFAARPRLALARSTFSLAPHRSSNASIFRAPAAPLAWASPFAQPSAPSFPPFIASTFTGSNAHGFRAPVPPSHPIALPPRRPTTLPLNTIVDIIFNLTLPIIIVKYLQIPS
jgi:hypothetical protein